MKTASTLQKESHTAEKAGCSQTLYQSITAGSWLDREKVHKQQPLEDYQEKSIQEFGRTSQGLQERHP